MAIRILSSESISGNITIHSPSNAPYIDFVENADTGDSKARITMDQIDTNNGQLIFSTEKAGTLTTALTISQSQNVDIAGNLNLSVASSFITTSAGDIYLNPASNNTTLYDGTNAQIFNVYNAGNLSIKLDSVAGTYGGVLLNQAGTNFVHGISGQGLVLSHHNIGASNAIVSGDASNPDNLYINNGGAASDWSNVIIEGNVGIGAAPNTKLEVRGGSGSGEIAHATFTATANRGLKISTTSSPFGQNSGTVIFNAQDGEGYSQQWFQIGGATKMIINNSGNVGIGYTGLYNQISGGENTLAIGDADNASLYLKSDATDGHNHILFSGTGGSLSFYDKTRGDYNMVIKGDGNVGINSTNPGQKLAIEGGGAANESILRVNNQGQVSSRIWLRNAGQSAYIFNSGTTADTLATGLLVQSFGMGINNNSPIQFYNGVSASVKMTIASSGKVGIGTVSPDSSLHIASTTTHTAVIRMENTNTAIGSGETYGEIQWEGNDINTGANGIRASIQVQGYGAGTQGETSMAFRTSYIGVDKNLTRLEIGHLGQVIVNPNSLSSGGFVNQYRAGQNVGQTAVGISNTSTYGGLAMIWMNYVGNIGYDLVSWSLSQVTVLSSQMISGGTSSRTYTAVGGVLKLRMGGSDTYAAYVSDIRNSTG